MSLNNSIILITGGTGSFGREFVKQTLSQSNPKKIIIFSRDEMKQWEMALDMQEYSNLEFKIGDVRDKDSLRRVFRGVDYVIHAAATKIVPLAEYNPFECVNTNIFGSINVIEVAIEQGVQKIVALSTDKASSPINLYGATKLTADKLFVAANMQTQNSETKFAVVRYGNVMGSRGSLIPFLLSLKESENVPLTDTRMTRFMITLQQGVQLVWHALDDMIGGEIYVKKIPSMKVIDIIDSVLPQKEIEIIGIRAGEKLHEQMIGEDDSHSTYEYVDYFKILPTINKWHLDKERIKDGTRVSANFSYKSDTNTKWMTKQELKNWINLNYREI